MVHPGPPPTAPQKRQTASPVSAPATVAVPAVPAAAAPQAAAGDAQECAHRAAAESAVNSMVDVAATNASLQEERARVQGLINGLVSRVAAGGGEVKKPAQQNAASDASAQKELTAPAKKASAAPRRVPQPPQGVPLNDHRQYVVRGGPLSWSQNADSVTVVIAVPSWVRKEHVVVRFAPGALAVRVGFASTGDAQFEITQPLFGAIDVDGSLWMLEGAGQMRKLTLEMEKGRVRWWARLFMADDPADYSPVVADALGSPLSAESDSPPPPPPAESACKDAADGEPSPPPPDAPPPEVEAEEEAEVPEEAPLNDAVQEVVDEIVDQVVSSTQKTSRRAGVFGAPEGVRRAGQQKVLTAADIARMAEQYKAAVRAGGPGAAHAALQLGMFHHHGIGALAQNDGIAAKYYKFALENGALDPEAAFRLGLIYNQGADGIEPDAEQAVRWWRVAARLGNAVAMFNLGVMAMNGSGCDMDPVEAVAWFRRAQTLNPQLTPPSISKAQLAERMKIAERVRKERAKENMSPEEKQQMRDAAMEDIRTVGYATAGVAAITVAAFAIRHWWQNRL